MNKSEKAWTDKVCELGCIVCKQHGFETLLVSPHHIDGRTKPGVQYLILPLCGAHHQLACPQGSWATRHGPGRNAGKVAFESEYGTEEELLEQVRELCGWAEFQNRVKV